MRTRVESANSLRVSHESAMEDSFGELDTGWQASIHHRIHHVFSGRELSDRLKEILKLSQSIIAVEVRDHIEGNILRT